ncbi:Nramp family divalent metal transporter [Nocardioides sp. NPDC127503]|uniref:Nramp family divalent metal transporter n=1 Tax=Nocardioides sp. NPDC127503 TaxID=3154516 RepID=UPI00331E3647
MGPAFVAAIAYVDPGNVATNLSAGAQHGYLLVWVVVLANAMAVVVQYLSAKLGVVTGSTLPELLGERLDGPARRLYWLQAEVTTAATDVAEVIGGAIALQILFELPLFLGGLVVGLVSMAVLDVQSRRGQRPFEFVVIGFLAVIGVGFGVGLLVSPVDWAGTAGGLVPGLAGPDTVLLAAGIIGATVMPHAVYVHSGLARDRHGRSSDLTRIARLLRATRFDVVAALAVAGGINLAMLLMAAGALRGVPGTDSIEGAADAIGTHLGTGIGILFGVALLASGLASTAVGCHAGAAITAGLLHVRVPLLLRRSITLVPALVLLVSGVDATWALVISQVVLSFGITFALIPLAWYTSRPELMGSFTNRRILQVASVLVTTIVVSLNVVLLALAV